MWQEERLCHRQDAEGQREENGEDLEGNQLGEGLVDVARVAKAQSEVFDRDPQEGARRVDVSLSVTPEGVQAEKLS